MKIGIGCVTYNRPLHLQHWIKQVAQFSLEDNVIHIADDNKKREGVAVRSNECLRELYNQNCEYFFLFNDDCFPIKKNWESLFILASQQSGHQHFQLMKESNATKIIGVASDKELESPIEVNVFDNCNGAFLFFTRKCLETVGGFNPNFFYGWEHSNLSNRIHEAKLTPFGKYSCPANAHKYIYSLDLEPESELHRKLKHKGSMTSKEALSHVNKGAVIYKNDHQLYFPL